MIKVSRARCSSRLVVFAIAVSALLAISSVQSAQADDALDLSDAARTISDVSPTLLSQTSSNPSVDVIDSSSNAAPEISVAANSGTGAPGVTWSVDYATGTSGAVEGLTVLETEIPEVVAYVQPTASGVRVLTAIGSRDAPSSYSYTFGVPDGTVLTEGIGGFYLESGTDVLGTILAPWAIDSSGAKLPTSYTWSGRTLTQHVDLTSPSIDFPVLADPAWGYTYTYATTKSPTANKALLKNCFNCYFPVAGAPRAFPSVGQLLPLRVGPANFECKFKSEFNGTNYFGYQFDGTKNHVDGLGSNIVFEFKLVGGAKRLIVSAYIVNDAWWLNNGAYKQGALDNWRNFASKLNAA